MTDKALRKLGIARRKAELKGVQAHDKTRLDDNEVWFIIDTRWLNKWAAFVDEGPEPGPISSTDLVDSKGNPLPNLRAKIDYRGVCPMVYYILKEFHGQIGPEISRYECDIYSRKVKDTDMIHIYVVKQAQAASSAKSVASKWRGDDTLIAIARKNQQDHEPSNSICESLMWLFISSPDKPITRKLRISKPLKRRQGALSKAEVTESEYALLDENKHCLVEQAAIL